MTLRSRSCVIGRGVAMFSIWSAMAFASKMPTQIGSTRCPSLSRRITIGMLVMGSTIKPLMVISICMALQPRRRERRCQTLAPRVDVHRVHGASPDAVRSRALDAHRDRSADPRRRSGQVDDDVAARAARHLGAAASARRIDEDVDLPADEPLVHAALDFTLQPLQRDDPPRLLVVWHLVGQ